MDRDPPRYQNHMPNRLVRALLNFDHLAKSMAGMSTLLLCTTDHMTSHDVGPVLITSNRLNVLYRSGDTLKKRMI